MRPPLGLPVTLDLLDCIRASPFATQSHWSSLHGRNGIKLSSKLTLPQPKQPRLPPRPSPPRPPPLPHRQPPLLHPTHPNPPSPPIHSANTLATPLLAPRRRARALRIRFLAIHALRQRALSQPIYLSTSRNEPIELRGICGGYY